jgi:AbrB family transcriptional regulator, transcriptional pleiotropic regulator of transition state genes
VKTTGMSRKIDDLGRLVLPAEIRRHFGLREGTHLEIQVEDDRIVLTKVEDRCVFCGSRDGLQAFRDRLVCRTCSHELGNSGNGAASAGHAS